MSKSAYLCGVPPEKCCGSLCKANKWITAQVKKSHGSSQAAFECMKNYLVKQGFTKIGSREFSPADGGPVRVLTKKCRYGARLRQGKEKGRVRPVKKWGGVVVG
jgi:hypothetical protein